ncbi:MAG TPA: glycosyltransferase [Bacteroidetes bacterium]|nr:glycosyltransferase [Bacteroidota bacterium]
MIPEQLEYILLAVYFISLCILFVYGFHGYIMVHLYRKNAHKTPPDKTLQDSEAPMVTIQLPVYNEFYVLDRLVRAACSVDYPREKLHIQILDDSTDETVERSRFLVEKYSAEGFDIQLLHRSDRTGYKAGALRDALPQAKGEFIAIFDADFIPPRDFLRKTLPHFSSPDVGVVQTRWGHLNHDFSLLTRAQAIALDGHFVVEQAARNRSDLFINFNGTAGVWRKQCILDAGNWSDDTLTEDLDLSYRAQMRGWRFVYLQDVVCMAELPGKMTALKSQQFRWTKGAIETARKILPKLWQSDLPLRVKLQGTIHLTNNMVFPFILLVALLNLPTMLLKNSDSPYSLFFAVCSFFVLAFFGSFLLYLHGQKEVYPDWKSRIAYFPVFLGGSMGLSLNNSWAILQGALKIKSPFQRTPKFNIEGKNGSWNGKKYQGKETALVVLELLMTVYTTSALGLAVYYQEWAALPFMSLFAFGFAFIACTSCQQAGWTPERLGVALKALVTGRRKEPVTTP